MVEVLGGGGGVLSLNLGLHDFILWHELWITLKNLPLILVFNSFFHKPMRQTE